MTSEREKFVSDEIEKKITDFKRDSDKHKNLHRSLRYGSFFLTAMLSILSGMALYYPEYSTTFNATILALGAIAGFVASFEGIRKADELWIHERTIFYELSDLQRELQYRLLSRENNDDVLDDIFSRLQTILTNSGEKWSGGDRKSVV